MIWVDPFTNYILESFTTVGFFFYRLCKIYAKTQNLFMIRSKVGGKVKVGDKKRGTQLDSSLESGRRDSNPRPSAWKANALSTELLPQVVCGQ